MAKKSASLRVPLTIEECYDFLCQLGDSLVANRKWNNYWQKGKADRNTHTLNWKRGAITLAATLEFSTNNETTVHLEADDHQWSGDPFDNVGATLQSFVGPLETHTARRVPPKWSPASMEMASQEQVREMSNDWEYEDYVLIPEGGQAEMGTAGSQVSYSDIVQQSWSEIRPTVLEEIQAWLNDGWEPLTQISPDSMQVETGSRGFLGGQKVYLKEVRIKMRRRRR